MSPYLHLITGYKKVTYHNGLRMYTYQAKGDSKSLIMGHKTLQFDENGPCQVVRASGHEYERLQKLLMAANGRKWPICHSFRLKMEGADSRGPSIK